MTTSIEKYKQSMLPSTFDEAKAFAKILSDSELVPKDYRGKPGNVLVAMQMGAELGLSPMQAIQNIAVINGRPSVWGDALLAIVQAHPDFEDIIEEPFGSGYQCTIKRKGRTPTVRSFTAEEAKRAGLAGKAGPWSTYPDRMMQMRARGFAIRDAFADALRGLISAEEALDYPTADRVPPPSPVIAEAVPTSPKQDPHTTPIADDKSQAREESTADADNELRGLHDILDQVLWAVKDSGCALTEKESKRLDEIKTLDEYKKAIAYFENKLKADDPPL